MKRVFCLFLIILAVLPLCACESVSHGLDEGKITVVSTVFPPYDFVRQIAEDKVNCVILLSPGKDSHSFEPTPKDMLTLKECDVFIYGGGESDQWAQRLIESSLDEDAITVRMMDAVELLCSDGHSHHDEHGEHEYDEHVWTSPENAALICEGIAEALILKDKENEEFYKKRLNEYKAELEALSADIRETVNTAKRQFIVMADRFPLLYFAKEYSLDYLAAFPGCNSNTEPTPKVVAELIGKVKSEEIPVIFKLELSSGSTANAVSEATGAKVLTFHSCHNLSKEDFDMGETYLSLMRRNVESLKIALN